MNKMNLPAPFGAVTETPPIVQTAQAAPVAGQRRKRDDLVASDESEMESDDDAVPATSGKGASHRVDLSPLWRIPNWVCARVLRHVCHSPSSADRQPGGGGPTADHPRDAAHPRRSCYHTFTSCISVCPTNRRGPSPSRSPSPSPSRSPSPGSAVA